MRSLPRAVGPGQDTTVTLTCPAPDWPGVFLLELDLVREGEHWFADDGSPAARVVLQVASPPERRAALDFARSTAGFLAVRVGSTILMRSLDDE